MHHNEKTCLISPDGVSDSYHESRGDGPRRLSSKDLKRRHLGSPSIHLAPILQINTLTQVLSTSLHHLMAGKGMMSRRGLIPISFLPHSSMNLRKVTMFPSQGMIVAMKGGCQSRIMIITPTLINE